jgi:catechol 2,3-dioxygenase-like lactoylglutathione lyase family enzyme
MITGAHVILFSTDPDADREFFRDILKFPNVDAGDGWLIFALPPAEVAVHPADENTSRELYLLCDDLRATMEALKRRNVRCSKPVERDWGTITSITLPGGGELGLYQPKHPLAPHEKSQR